MKKVIAVLGLFAIIAAVITTTTFKAHAYPAPQYRWRFQPITTTCWNYCTYYPAAGTQYQFTLNDNPSPVTTGPGDMMLVNTYTSCCPGPTQIGYKWEEVSTDGGGTWTLVSPTFLPFYQPQGSSSELYLSGSSGMQPYTSQGGCR